MGSIQCNYGIPRRLQKSPPPGKKFDGLNTKNLPSMTKHKFLSLKTSVSIHVR